MSATRFSMFLATLLPLGGCSGTPTDSSTEDRDRVERAPGYHVHYGNNTVVLDTTIVRLALQTVDTANHRYTFSAPVLTDRNITLQPGRVLLLSGTALRKITGVQQTSDRVVVSTEYATRNEAIREGTIEWSRPLEFTPTLLQGAARGGERFAQAHVSGRECGRLPGRADSEFPDAGPYRASTLHSAIT
jgi:hypothetical protein